MSSNNLVVQAEEYSFSPTHTAIMAGEEVTITLENIGEVEHDLQIKELKADMMVRETSYNHQNSNNDIHVHTMPGDKQAISFIPVTPGKYSYVCKIPGHAEAGMIGVIEVLSL
ncbi:plastocyanin/azurin family copper-binding protein [Virgibacillus sediminis]|uniref:Plastocyanin/azurin family copper-binding protein n=1 Tax=Virgibacillus sediminis TaxID=202260 RepID=A0ABV7A5B5_9BACI